MNSTAPLAERMRPIILDELVGQEHLTGRGSILRTAIEQGNIPSMILWGPPGVGKTSTIRCIAKMLFGKYYNKYVLELNASDDRGIGVVRNKMGQSFDAHTYQKSMTIAP